MLKNLGPSYLLYAFINLKLWADYMKRIDHGGRFIMVSGLNCSWPRPRIASSINWTFLQVLIPRNFCNPLAAFARFMKASWLGQRVDFCNRSSQETGQKLSLTKADDDGLTRKTVWPTIGGLTTHIIGI